MTQATVQDASDPTLSVFRRRVPFYETDGMGIVHHANYLRFCEDGRVEWFRRRGIVYTAWIEHGVDFVVAESHLFYRSPARFDEMLVIETRMSELARLSVHFSYRIHAQHDGRLVLEGKTVHACIDTKTMRLKRIPDWVREEAQRAERPECFEHPLTIPPSP